MSDYAALAQRVAAGASGIRGCLLLSRDGDILGAHPEGETESQVKAAWLRFAGVGEPERSYVEFPDQTWAFVRRGGYAAFAVADVGVRPGVLVDLLDQVLLAGEVERIQEREAMRVPEAPVAPSGKPRTILHKQERFAAPTPDPAAEPPPAVAEIRILDAVGAPAPEPIAAAVEGDAEAAGVEPAGEPADRPAAQPEVEEETEVDRILLAKEFAGLLQVPRDDDEATR
ncbi:MAG TPA: hypothetical protein VFQ40_05625 [Actinomycetota bacterium]|nr:hypothetical protein [Actinomycetota bacterium]